MKLRRIIATAVIATAGWHMPAMAGDVVVSAAASLTNAFKELASNYEKDHADTKILTSFAASDVLLQQIIHGAPADIFASADQKAMDKAVEAGVVESDSRTDFVRNEVVMIVPVDDKHGIKSVADLKNNAVTRVAFGNPATVPVGRYTQASLEKMGDWEVVKSKEVTGQNVRQVLDYVARGEVDAGFVFATDAAIMTDKVKVVQRLESATPVLYPIALVNRDGRNPQAKDFLSYVLSAQGQAVLAKYGFARP
ncbi:MAG: molybdate ABC transporter substrate-binding protein [Burkholderiaceae bacterium]|nr:molybdate ABC transporter substrate-binding protein [Burkholderiaceae bacterium]